MQTCHFMVLFLSSFLKAKSKCSSIKRSYFNHQSAANSIFFLAFYICLHICFSEQRQKAWRVHDVIHLNIPCFINASAMHDFNWIPTSCNLLGGMYIYINRTLNYNLYLTLIYSTYNNVFYCNRLFYFILYLKT